MILFDVTSTVPVVSSFYRRNNVIFFDVMPKAFGAVLFKRSRATLL